MPSNGIETIMMTISGRWRQHLSSVTFWILICSCQTMDAYAHGAQMSYQLTTGVVVQALYDSGLPMSSAQLTVYAPDDPTRAWLTGNSNDQGVFSFVPDPEVSGIWSVQARQAGHGAMIHIAVDKGDETALTPQATQVQPGSSLLQRLLMAATVIWGCIGTALYYKRGRST